MVILKQNSISSFHPCKIETLKRKNELKEELKKIKNSNLEIDQTKLLSY